MTGILLVAVVILVIWCIVLSVKVNEHEKEIYGLDDWVKDIYNDVSDIKTDLNEHRDKASEDMAFIFKVIYDIEKLVDTCLESINKKKGGK